MNILKRIFFWSSAFLLIMLLTLFNIANKLYTTKHPDHVHITIYIDRNFDDVEQEYIIAAALEWSETTNHIVDYDTIQLPTNNIIDMNHALIINKVSPDDSEIILLDGENENKNNTLAYYTPNDTPHIAIVSERLTDDNYTSTILHELGHSLGLKHNEGFDGIGTLMFPATNMIVDGIEVPVGARHITLKDGQKFCKLYRCNANKLKYKEESLHF